MKSMRSISCACNSFIYSAHENNQAASRRGHKICVCPSCPVDEKCQNAQKQIKYSQMSFQVFSFLRSYHVSSFAEFDGCCRIRKIDYVTLIFVKQENTRKIQHLHGVASAPSVAKRLGSTLEQ